MYVYTSFFCGLRGIGRVLSRFRLVACGAVRRAGTYMMFLLIRDISRRYKMHDVIYVDYAVIVCWSLCRM